MGWGRAHVLPPSPAHGPPARPGRRPLRWSSLPYLALAAAVVMATVQGAGSLAAARLAQAALEKGLGGPVEVTVQAVPVWKLAEGRFDRLTVRGTHLRLGRLHVARLYATWWSGQVDLSRLRVNAPMGHWARGGTMAVSLAISPQALRRMLPQQGSLVLSSLTLDPPYLVVRGRVTFGGVHLPFAAQGIPQVGSHGQTVLYRLTVFHAGPLGLRDPLTLPLVNLRGTLADPVLHVVSTRVGRDFLWLVLRGDAGTPSGPRSLD
jgi:hypothetical protein